MAAISRANQKTLQQIRLHEVNKTYGKYEDHINRQYESLGAMLEQVENAPGCSQDYMKTFKDVYEANKSDLALEVFYRGVVGRPVFGRSLAAVYLQVCGGNRVAVETMCSNLVRLFCRGLVALAAYTFIAEDDGGQVVEKWASRMAQVQARMTEMLENCEGS